MSTPFKLSRRDLLLSLPALSVARRVLAQSGTKFKIRALNHMTIAVTDPKRTIEFYQTLFGMTTGAKTRTNRAISPTETVEATFRAERGRIAHVHRRPVGAREARRRRHGLS